MKHLCYLVENIVVALLLCIHHSSNISFLLKKKKIIWGKLGRSLEGEKKYSEGTDEKINSFTQYSLQNFEALSDIVCK